METPSKHIPFLLFIFIFQKVILCTIRLLLIMCKFAPLNKADKSWLMVAIWIAILQQPVRLAV